MNILASIHARGGSKGVKNKNIRILAGKPLIAHSVQQIIKWGKYKHFVVSTDSEDIANVAREYGADVPFMRPDDLANDHACKMDAMRDTFKKAEEHYSCSFDALLDLDATAPLRTVADIQNIVDMFARNKAESIFSAVLSNKNPYLNMVEKNDDGLVYRCKIPEKPVHRRQDVKPVYSLNASLYIFSKEFLMDPSHKRPMGEKSYIYEMDEISTFDIDREIDFRFIEFILDNNLFQLE